MKGIQVLYEDDEVIAVNKPAGLAVQGGEGVGNPLDALLPAQLGYAIYLVHRLDKDTAGILLVAKSPASAAKYSTFLNGKTVQKIYIAHCFGKPAQKNGTIDVPIFVKNMQKDAQTTYRECALIQASDKLECAVSRVEFTLNTGRMHQIRIHAAKSGFPIIGDDKYGNFKLNREVRRLFGVKRLQLAACTLDFPASDGKLIHLHIDLPEHLSAFWDACSQNP